MIRFFTYFLCLLFVHFSILPLHSQVLTSEELDKAMAGHLSCFPLQQIKSDEQEISITDEELCLASIYLATGLKPLWISPEGPDSNAFIIFDFLKNAAADGLEPDDYGVNEIRGLWNSREADKLAQLDTQLTLGLVKYIHDMTYGRIEPYEKAPDLFAEAGDKHFRPVLLAQQAINAPDLSTYLAGLPPRHAHYRKLREALSYYRDLALKEQDQWVQIEDGPNIRSGSRDKRMHLIRQRLAWNGFPSEVPEDPGLYDKETENIVKEFQQSFGLVTDGIIGINTLAALNLSPEDRVEKITLNMARWRWQSHELGQRYILVNIAGYDLRFFENNRELITMPVIVGKYQHQTPVFSDRIRYIDFNPFWNIPPSIARNEELPALQKDPYHLVNRHVRLFSSWQNDAIELDSTQIDWNSITRSEMNRYKLRQDPGPWNALGQIKFVFPNHHNVYIHGTPAIDLFERSSRSFSHGCIRASAPLQLARLILSEANGDWTVERIQEVVALGERKIISLPESLPVHITYQTVWFDNQGKIHFNNDIYNRDKKLSEIFTSLQLKAE